MYSSGEDSSGENVLHNSKFSLHLIPSLHEKFLALRKIKSPIRQKSNNSNYYTTIKSETITPPFGSFTLKTFISKWVLFAVYTIDNVALIIFLSVFRFHIIGNSKAIVGYECGYTLAAKAISVLFRIPYINKFQGTVLKATDRDPKKAVMYFPYNYFGINRANLCLMVDDGTDGHYYASRRGNSNVYFEPHGVSIDDYREINSKSSINTNRFNGKFIIFNNASGSTWKRTDRVIRALQYIDIKTLEKLVFLTTYKAPDKQALQEYTKLVHMEKYVEFLDNIDHITSNYLVQNSNILIMTNEMSNLGNPVLEAIYYGTPLISLNDGSLDKYVINGENAVLLDLNGDFDIKLAEVITQFVEDKNFYSRIKENSQKNTTVHTLEEQQNKEVAQIQKVLYAK